MLSLNDNLITTSKNHSKDIIYDNGSTSHDSSNGSSLLTVLKSWFKNLW